MFLVSSCSCLCPIHWSQVLSREWRCSWSSADRRCCNYIWVINNCIAYYRVRVILEVHSITIDVFFVSPYIYIYIYTLLIIMWIPQPNLLSASERPRYWKATCIHSLMDPEICGGNFKSVISAHIQRLVCHVHEHALCCCSKLDRVTTALDRIIFLMLKTVDSCLLN